MSRVHSLHHTLVANVAPSKMQVVTTVGNWQFSVVLKGGTGPQNTLLSLLPALCFIQPYFLPYDFIGNIAGYVYIHLNSWHIKYPMRL